MDLFPLKEQYLALSKLLVYIKMVIKWNLIESIENFIEFWINNEGGKGQLPKIMKTFLIRNPFF